MRVVVIVASSIAILVIGITIWLQTQQSAPASAGAVQAPRRLDTTGGQEMRPRWDNSGGQSHDATGN